MKFGVREICDVVLKAVVDGQRIGDMTYKAGQPVMYFDSLKTSSMEQASTTVYAQGGKGNSRLISWDGDKTITFTMEDALLSPLSFAILAKAGLTKHDDTKNPLIVHCSGRVTAVEGKLPLEGPVKADLPFWYVSIPEEQLNEDDHFELMKQIPAEAITDGAEEITKVDTTGTDILSGTYFVDYYITKELGDNYEGYTITIEPESFEGNFYLEASTLFRAKSGIDLPAEFIIPMCKPQSNMTFAMSGTGDPSTFTFTMDAFPGYTKYNPNKKVLSAIQIFDAVTDINDIPDDGLTQF